MESQLEKNKQVVQRFNKEVIEDGNPLSFKELMDDGFINHTAMPGVSNGADGMLYVFESMLRPAFPGMKVTIYEQVAEGDLVTTRKTITGKHTGTFMKIAPTGKDVVINVIDMVRVRDGKYYEHWGANNLAGIMAQLSKE